MPAELRRDASFSAMSLLVHDETWTVNVPLPDGGGVNFGVVAGSVLCVDREGAVDGVDGAGVDEAGVDAADGSRLGSGVGVTSVAGAVDPWSVVFKSDAADSGGGS
jgi:hypothetical protein